jgi:AcrR family transcriptional regulator
MESNSTRSGARRQREDGARSRAAILEAAARLATLEGLDGLSIGRLAELVGMSKSGLFAHFGSKEELQLATIDAANEIYAAEVVLPALAAPSGLRRLEALCELFLSHVERSVFPGGCFFASVSSEMDTKQGPVRNRAAEIVGEWLALLAHQIADAQSEGDLDAHRGPRAAGVRAQRAAPARQRAVRHHGRPYRAGADAPRTRTAPGARAHAAGARLDASPAGRSRRRRGWPPTPRAAAR